MGAGIPPPAGEGVYLVNLNLYQFEVAGRKAPSPAQTNSTRYMEPSTWGKLGVFCSRPNRSTRPVTVFTARQVLPTLRWMISFAERPRMSDGLEYPTNAGQFPNVHRGRRRCWIVRSSTGPKYRLSKLSGL